jgi:hypothetical protein
LTTTASEHHHVEAGARGGIRLQVPGLYAIAALIVLVGILLVGMAPRFDPDFWWHLKVGQYITNQHAVPSHDYLSYWFTGHSWIDHEWLPEALMYELYRVWGLEGPVFFFGLVIGATYTLVYLTMVALQVNRLVAMALLILCAVASTGSWGPRIQMLSLLFTAAYALALHRFTATRDRRWLVVFPLIMLLWTNSHGGFVIGLGLMVLWLLGEWANRRAGNASALGTGDLKALAITVPITLAVTLINPNGLRQLTYPLTFVLPNPFTNLIQESASPNFHLFIFMVFMGLLLLLLAAFLAHQGENNWTHLLLALAFTYLALDQSRNVPLWCVVLTPILALYTQRMFGWSFRPKRLAGGFKSVVNLVFVALILLVALRGGAYITSASTFSSFQRSAVPVRAVDYLQRHHLPSHVLVEYTWGGYLLWRLFPAYRPFMDSRADTLYTASVLNGYLDMFNAAASWSSDLQEYKVQTVLLPPRAPLLRVLQGDKHWRKVYADSDAMIYTRRRAG